MYIKLTNAHPDFLDKPIVINTANIVAVYEQEVAPKLWVTCIHCPPHGTWNVRETLEEVLTALDVKTPGKTVVVKHTVADQDPIEVIVSESVSKKTTGQR